MQASLRPTGANCRRRRADHGAFGISPTTLAWTALIAATGALTIAAAGKGVLPGDVAVARAIQQASLPGADPLVAVVNAIGGTVGFLLVAAAVAWWAARRGHGAAVLVVLGAIALRYSNILIKLFVASPRPSPNVVQVAEQADGYGFPSAHVMGVVLLYGAILVLASELFHCRARRCLVRAAALTMLLTIGYARVYAGAHWPSDVLGAYLYGILGLAGLLALHRAIRSGRLPDPEPPSLAAFARLARTGAAALRSLLPVPPVRRPAAQRVPIRTRAVIERERRPS